MRFKINPQLILTKEDKDILNKAMILCQEMDEATLACPGGTGEELMGCGRCPFQSKCTFLAKDCIYTKAYEALEEILNIAVVE